MSEVYNRVCLSSYHLKLGGALKPIRLPWRGACLVPGRSAAGAAPGCALRTRAPHTPGPMGLENKESLKVLGQ
eukprot:6814705-Pyramimonas_sp.AAC.1